MFHFTETPDILARHIQTGCLGCRTSFFILPVLQILFIIVDRGFTSNNGSKENNRIIFMASSKRSENETAERMKGKFSHIYAFHSISEPGTG